MIEPGITVNNAAPVTAESFDAHGTRTGSVALPEEIFGQTPHRASLHAYAKMYQTNQRQGTAKTLTRAEVSGGGIKPWRQKGTGRARAGSNTSPLWVGGGIVHGPRPHKHHEKLPRRVRRLALVSALSLKAREGNIRVWAREELNAPKTKSVNEAFARMGVAAKRTLLLDEGSVPNFAKSCRNIPWLTHRRADLANAYQVMRAKELVLSPDGLRRLTEAIGVE
ncbi:MAG TPA: 50S ribosomal protein L4 [candidate division Zixibacteria bacterium]|jgi:large subunit ribosomal protein L4